VFIALLGVVPLLVYGPSCGHDFDFHLQSWLAVTAAWHGGVPAPQWLTSANYNAGEPRFLFYPPLSWLLGAALSLVLRWAVVPAAFTAICLCGAAVSMYRLARRYTGCAGATAAASLYALSPYLLFNAYERSAYAELLAALWFPLLFASLLQAVEPAQPNHPKTPPQWLQIAGVALPVAALWYTNAPSGVMGCYLVLFAAGFVVLFPGQSVSDRLRAAAQLLWSLILGCLLAGDYLLPAWYNQRFVEIDRAIGPDMRVQDSFLFARTADSFHDEVLRTASWIFIATIVSAAFAIATMAVAHTIGYHRRRQQRQQRRLSGVDSSARAGAGFTQSAPTALRLTQGAATTTRSVVFVSTLIVLCAMLQLPFSLPAWHLLPQLAFLQFPWRWLLPVSCAAALLCAMALRCVGTAMLQRRSSPEPSSKVQLRTPGLLAIVLCYAAAITLWAAHTRYQPCDDEDRVTAQLSLLTTSDDRQGPGFEGTDEYTPKGADNGEIQQGLPPVRLLRAPDADEGDDSTNPNPPWHPNPAQTAPGSIQIERWPSPAHPGQLALNVTTNGFSTPVYAVLRLERFAAWRIQLNRHPCAAECVLREDGLLTVRVAPRGTTRITGTYDEGFYAAIIASSIASSVASTSFVTSCIPWLGRLLSLAAVIVLFALRGTRQKPSAGR
jgi:hypothetical protein